MLSQLPNSIIIYQFFQMQVIFMFRYETVRNINSLLNDMGLQFIIRGKGSKIFHSEILIKYININVRCNYQSFHTEIHIQVSTFAYFTFYIFYSTSTFCFETTPYTRPFAMAQNSLQVFCLVFGLFPEANLKVTKPV